MTILSDLESNDKYSKSIKAIQAISEEYWKENKQIWYTDHGVDHSIRIIEIIDKMLVHLSNGKSYLSLNESFVLASSIFLHDIGMQCLIFENNHTIDNLTEDDRESVRHLHPQKSYELIKSLGHERLNAIPILFEKPTYLQLIAVIARAHGTNYYEESLSELKKMSIFLDQEGIRGPLLASLILFGDEMDITETRVANNCNFYTDKYTKFPLISQAHICCHHFITSATIGCVDRKLQIQIGIKLPTNQDKELVQAIGVQHVCKLRKQILMIRNSINDLPVELNIKPALQYTEMDTLDFEDDVKKLIISNYAEWKLIDRLDLTQKIREYIQLKTKGCALLVTTPQESDKQAIVNWITKLCKCTKHDVVLKFFDSHNVYDANPTAASKKIIIYDNTFYVDPEAKGLPQDPIRNVLIDHIVKNVEFGNLVIIFDEKANDIQLNAECEYYDLNRYTVEDLDIYFQTKLHIAKDDCYSLTTCCEGKTCQGTLMSVDKLLNKDLICSHV